MSVLQLDQYDFAAREARHFSAIGLFAKRKRGLERLVRVDRECRFVVRMRHAVILARHRGSDKHVHRGTASGMLISSAVTTRCNTE